eukprot:snap_masked-scaffold_92-processed-gene-0.22-mRNA-1 protein AED:1.00 eAED:1.00 QI:0/-1/0/0/-1/1/1/0/64
MISRTLRKCHTELNYNNNYVLNININFIFEVIDYFETEYYNPRDIFVVKYILTLFGIAIQSSVR